MRYLTIIIALLLASCNLADRINGNIPSVDDVFNTGPDNKSDSRNPDNKNNPDIVDRDNRVNTDRTSSLPVFDSDHLYVHTVDAGTISGRNGTLEVEKDLVVYGAGFGGISGKPVRPLTLEQYVKATNARTMYFYSKDLRFVTFFYPVENQEYDEEGDPIVSFLLDDLVGEADDLYYEIYAWSIGPEFESLPTGTHSYQGTNRIAIMSNNHWYYELRGNMQAVANFTSSQLQVTANAQGKMASIYDDSDALDVTFSGTLAINPNGTIYGMLHSEDPVRMQCTWDACNRQAAAVEGTFHGNGESFSAVYAPESYGDPGHDWHNENVKWVGAMHGTRQ